MVFSSLTFLYAFLPLVVLPYYLGKNRTYRNGALLVFSLLFYAWGEPKYVVLLVAATLIAYLGGLGLTRFRGNDTRRVVFWVTVLLVVGNLLV